MAVARLPWNAPVAETRFESAVRDMLELVGEDPAREGLLKTPERVERAMRWLTRGYELDAAEDRLRMFLEQYWGGPRTYSELRGHPRLRMRHVPFKIGFIERDAWLRCMHTAVASIDSQTLDEEHRRELLAYLDMAAQSMVNSPF